MLQIDGLDVDGGTAAGCTFSLERFDAPEAPLLSEAMDDNPRTWDNDLHGDATRTATVRIVAADGPTANEGRTYLYQRLRKGVTVFYTPRGGDVILETTLRACTPISDTSELSGMKAEAGMLTVTLNMRTAPYWVGPRVDVSSGALTPTSGAIAQGRGFVNVDLVPGDVPALTMVTVTHAQATTMTAIGLRSNPSASGTAFVQDYNGVSDAQTSSGCASVSGVPTSFISAVGTPTVLDAAAMKGDYLPIVRAKNGATTPGAMKLGWMGTASGPPVYGSSNVMPTTSSGGFDVMPLYPPVHVPVMNVPAGASSAGLDAILTDICSQETGTESYGGGGGYIQTISLPLALYSQLDVKIDSSTWATSVYVDGVAAGSIAGPATGWQTVANFSPRWMSGVHDLGFYGSSTTYVGDSDSAFGGELHQMIGNNYGTGAHVGGALLFRLWGYYLLSYQTTIGVSPQSSQASQTVKQDWTELLPIDEAAVIATFAAGAGEGIRLDNMAAISRERDLYYQTTGGTGYSLLASSNALGGAFMLRPGTNCIVVAAATPPTAAPGVSTVAVSYRPRYLSPGA